MSAHCYVPVLRWKQSERLALQDLYPADADLILPLIEIVPKMLAEGKLSQLPRQITKAWRGRRVFVDGTPPAARSDGQSEAVFRMLEAAPDSISAEVVPVIRPSDTPSARRAALDAAKAIGRGVAVRATPDEMPTIPSLMRDLGFARRDTDLLVDFGRVGRNDGRYAAACAGIPSPADWRTIAFLGGSFPLDLTGLSVGQHLLHRDEWRCWARLAQARVGRIPLFGDYAIQHAQYSEPPKFANVSASIRYAAPDDWVIMRGEGVRNQGGAGYDQWPANAQLLRERAEFCGPGFSRGDDYIELMGTGPPTTGNPGSWLRAGLNHHMTLACRQAASLL